MAQVIKGLIVDDELSGRENLKNLILNYCTELDIIGTASSACEAKRILDYISPDVIDFIMKIKPRMFNWDKREWYIDNKSNGRKMKDIPTAGFIAQELDEVQTTQNADWLNLVLKDNPEKLEATYGNLLPVIVKAIQDLKVENDKLVVESSKLKVESAQLKNENKEIMRNNVKLMSEVESLRSMNSKIVNLEKIVNELTSVKHASLSGDDVNIKDSK